MQEKSSIWMLEVDGVPNDKAARLFAAGSEFGLMCAISMMKVYFQSNELDGKDFDFIRDHALKMLEINKAEVMKQAEGVQFVKRNKTIH